MIRAGVLLAVLSGVSPCIAQEAPVIATTPVLSPKPVATDNEMLHKYVWSTIGFDGAISATLSSGLDQWRTSPTEWGDGREGYARRWLSNYAESAIGDGAKHARTGRALCSIGHRETPEYR